MFLSENQGRYLRSGVTRRDFLKASAMFAGALAVPPGLLAGAQDTGHPAMFQEDAGKGRVRCGLCPHRCIIPDRGRGICGVRENRRGSLVSLVYGRPCSMHLDPVEKKPFFHVLPGTASLSLSTVGCNMSCRFCQNWQISQSSPGDVNSSEVSPSEVVDKAVSSGASSVAFTYGEPVVFYEYMTDIAIEARRRSLLSLVVTNGYYTDEAIEALCGKVDAVKIDLKAFRDRYYREVCGATLEPVLRNLKTIAGSGVWLEIVYLMVPTLNDSDEEIADMAEWISSELGPSVPVHLSRFYPRYMLSDLPPTPVSSLERARKILLDRGIRYVYIGNVPGHPAGSTVCHSCGRTVIERYGYRIRSVEIEGDACGFCGEEVPGIWSDL